MFKKTRLSIWLVPMDGFKDSMFKAKARPFEVKAKASRSRTVLEDPIPDWCYKAGVQRYVTSECKTEWKYSK